MEQQKSSTIFLELTEEQFECILDSLDEFENECGPIDDDFYELMNYLVTQYRLKTDKNPYAILF